MNDTDSFHTPVLLLEAIEGLLVEKGKKYIDATLGGGGHTVEILKRGGVVLGIDQDREAIEHVKKKFQIGKELLIERGNFSEIGEIARRIGFTEVDGILFDLGMSSYQLKKPERGFSHKRDGPLDMRMDQSRDVTAETILNTKTEEELYEIFSTFSEELNSRAISRAIVRTRSMKGPIMHTGQLRAILMSFAHDDDTSMYARIFQALRIAVNGELERLKSALHQSAVLTKKGGRIAVISYHSLEDRTVKLFFINNRSVLAPVAKVPIYPSEKERMHNTRSRSAKLRIAEKEI